MGKKIKILGISACASATGRSELLLEASLGEFSKGASEVKKISVRDMKISFCDGLRGCEKSGTCKRKDDIHAIKEDISSSDAVVVSSPIYFTSIPAKLKAVVDRCQVYWAQKNLLKKFETKPKKGIFISVAGRQPDFKHAEVIIRAFFSIFNIEFSGKFYLPNTDCMNGEQFKEAVEKVRKLTREVAG